MGDEAPPDVPGQPQPPFAPEDGAYAAIVSEYVGLQRAGADPISRGADHRGAPAADRTGPRAGPSATRPGRLVNPVDFSY